MKKHLEKRSIFSQITIKRKLITSFLFLLLVPTILIGTISYKNAEKEIGNKIEQGAQQNIKLLDSYLNDFMNSYLHDVTYFTESFNSESASQKESSLKTLEQYLKQHSSVISVYLGTENKDILIQPVVELPSDFDVTSRPWYKEAKESNGKAVITEPYIDAITGDILITVAKEVSDGSGVVGIDLNLASLQKMAGEIKIGDKGYPFILSSKGSFLAHPTEKIGSEAKGEWKQTVLTQEKGQYSYENKKDNKSLFFLTNQLTGLKIVGTMSLSEIAEDSRPILISSIIIIAIFIIIGTIISFLITFTITRPLNRLVQVTERVSEGDLSQDFDINLHDEIGRLGTAFNKMIGSLRKLIHEVGDKADQLASSSEQLMASSEQNNSATEQVANSIQEVAAGTDNQTNKLKESTEIVKSMALEIQQIQGNTERVAQTSSEASNVVLTGEQAIQLSIQQMNQINENVKNLGQVIFTLGERSKEISQFANVISEIAGQTNLLALNAAIEAARAGEHGKGFAVVADEVRKLAEQSSKSTESIRQLISSIQSDTQLAVVSMDKGTKEVEKGIQVVHNAGVSFQQIQQFVDTVSTQINEISTSIHQMSKGAEKVVETVTSVEEIAIQTTAQSQDVSAATEEQLASMQEIAASAASLANMAEELQDSVKRFKL